MVKRVYQKPQLMAVRLVAEEQVLTFCKIAGNTTGPNTYWCGPHIGINECKVIGS